MLGNVIAYVYQMLMARELSPVEYGTLITLSSVSYVLAVVTRTAQVWVIRAVATTEAASAGRPRAAFIAAMRVLVPVAGAILLIHWLSSGGVASFLHLRSAVPVIVLGLYTSSSVLLPVPRGVLLGLGRLQFTGITYIVEPVVRLGTAMLLVLWGLGVDGALAGYALGNVAAFAVALVPLWIVLRPHDDGVPSTGDRGKVDRYAWLAFIINASLMVLASIDQIVVKHFFSGEVAGNYAVAFLLGRIIAFSTISLSWVIFTRSAIMSSDDPARGRLLAKGLLVTAAIAVSVTAAYLLGPTLAVRIMGGGQYATAATYVGLVGIEMTFYSLVYIQAYYQISVQQMQVIWPLGCATVLEIALLMRYHHSVQQVLLTLILVMAGLLVCVSALSWRSLRSGGPAAAGEIVDPDAPTVVAGSRG